MKKTVALIFGGEGAERRISELSAKSLLSCLDTDIYDVLKIGIAPSGAWYIYYGDNGKIGNGEWLSEKDKITPTFPAMLGEKSGFLTERGLVPVLCAVPALHGDFGEDGVVQGTLSAAHIRYVGQDVYASAMTSDKIYAKLTSKHLGIPTADFILSTEEPADCSRKRAEAEIGYPMFIKPARLGSSLGARPVFSESEFYSAHENAKGFDKRIMIEKLVDFDYELECAFFRTKEPLVCPYGKVSRNGRFYDYEAKYRGVSHEARCDSEIPAEICERVKAYTLSLANLIGIRHLSRFDFFVTGAGEIYFNEINVFPGMTETSLYPRLTERLGLKKGEFINELIRSVSE